MQENIWDNENLIRVLEEGGVVVMPTDTLYGIVGRAQNEDVVKRIYKIRGRNHQKPCIILIGDINELEKFSVFLSEKQKQILNTYWPGPVSVVLDCSHELFSYLHRGMKTLAFRIPDLQGLRDLLLKTGPLIAPSANRESFLPYENIIDAKKDFGNLIDLYVDGGERGGKASKVIRLDGDSLVTVLRE